MHFCHIALMSQFIFSSLYHTGTPFPSALKCFTCTDKYNNADCNAKAYDAFCPEGKIDGCMVKTGG